jgi:hypothetical protein
MSRPHLVWLHAFLEAVSSGPFQHPVGPCLTDSFLIVQLDLLMLQCRFSYLAVSEPVMRHIDIPLPF